MYILCYAYYAYQNDVFRQYIYPPPPGPPTHNDVIEEGRGRGDGGRERER